jgi:hypothetical protein
MSPRGRPGAAELVRADLEALAREYGLGGLINRIDSIGKHFGGDTLPQSAINACLPLHHLLHDLVHTSGAVEGASEVWREVP